MPLPLVPLAPLAGAALKYGGVALAAWLVARHVQPARIDQRAEDALDDLPDGFGARRPGDRGQSNLAGRYRRRIRIAGLDRTIELDAAFLARLRARQV